MNWPLVSRATHEVLVAELRGQIVAGQNYGLHWANRCAASDARYDALLDKYHALRVAGGNPAEAVPVAVPEPDVPPPEVLAAMQAISPQRDKTYDANWAYWEANKARATAYPKDFADEILQGAVFEPEGA